jgi:phospholipase C
MKVARCFRQCMALPIRPLCGLLILPCLLSCNLVDALAPSFQTSGPASCATGVEPAPERAACIFGKGASPSDTIACPDTGPDIPIQHIVVLMQENRSFDHYLGHLPGHGQDDVDVAPAGTSNPFPPGVTDGSGSTVVPWMHGTSNCFDSTNHSWPGSHQAWNQGSNDGFVIANAGSNDGEGNDPTGSRAMTYYDDSDLPFSYQLASTFAISDRYFSEVLGPTLPNRLYLYAGSSFGIVSGDIDTDVHRTIFGALNDRGISWKVYTSDVPAGLLTASFVADSIGHIASIDDFAEDARQDRLPAVSWVDPVLLTATATLSSEEPPADMQVGQQFVYRQVAALMSSSSWATSAMFITYDEAGGLFDHVPPPPACAPDATPPAQQGDLGGFDHYGFRVPLFVVSPYAKAHFVSHAVHSHTSILRFIEMRFGLPALSARDANADAMLDLFDFTSPAFLSPPDLRAPPIDASQLSACSAKYGR